MVQNEERGSLSGSGNTGKGNRDRKGLLAVSLKVQANIKKEIRLRTHPTPKRGIKFSLVSLRLQIGWKSGVGKARVWGRKNAVSENGSHKELKGNNKTFDEDWERRQRIAIIGAALRIEGSVLCDWDALFGKVRQRRIQNRGKYCSYYYEGSEAITGKVWKENEKIIIWNN